MRISIELHATHILNYVQCLDFWDKLLNVTLAFLSKE